MKYQNMNKIIKKLREIKYPYNPLVRVDIFKENIFHNLIEFSQHCNNAQVAPVLKSNAYGHGLVIIANLLDSRELPFFIVDTFYEALVLRTNSIKTRILIVGYTRPDNIYKKLIKNISYTITSFDQLMEISVNISRKFTFHLKIDTGMHRQGLLVSEFDQAIEIIKNNKYLVMEGLCSHLADASNNYFSLFQINVWNKLVNMVKKELPDTKYFHLAATTGAIYSNKIKANICRIGSGLYGVYPQSDCKFNLKPTLSLRSIITSIKSINPGDKVGYSCTFTAQKPMKIATVPIGYHEGVDLRLSNKGFFKVNNEFCSIIGRVSMNITTIDVSDVKQVKVGDEVIAISELEGDINSVKNITKTIRSIPYEVLVKLPPQLRRYLV